MQTGKAVKKAYCILAIIGRNVEYQNITGHVAATQQLSWAPFIILCTILVATLPEGCGCFGEIREDVYQDVVWTECISNEERLVNSICSQWKDRG